MRIRVLVLSDVPLYREGVARALADVGTIDVVGTAACARDAMDSARRLSPDIVLMDMSVPGALGVARDLARTLPAARVVALAMTEVEGHVIKCAEVGVAGFVPREGSVRDAVDVIEAVARGEARCSPRIVGSLLRRIATLAAMSGHHGARGSVGSLTARETEILALLQQGLSNKQISRRLGIELATVKNHVHSVFSKLGVHRRAQAAIVERAESPMDRTAARGERNGATLEQDEHEPLHQALRASH